MNVSVFIYIGVLLVKAHIMRLCLGRHSGSGPGEAAVGRQRRCEVLPRDKPSQEPDQDPPTTLQ